MIRLFYKQFSRLLFNGKKSVNKRRISLSLILNQQKEKNMKVLNVAEKNDAAKNIANCISRGGNRWVS